MINLSRDPIFYRWHTHNEDLAQEYRDKRLPPYTKDDFKLGDEIRKTVSSISLLLATESY